MGPLGKCGLKIFNSDFTVNSSPSCLPLSAHSLAPFEPLSTPSLSFIFSVSDGTLFVSEVSLTVPPSTLWVSSTVRLVLMVCNKLHIWTTSWQNQQNHYARSIDSDQPGHLKKAWVLSYPLSAQRRLIRLGRCPGWSQPSLGAQVILLGFVMRRLILFLKMI